MKQKDGPSLVERAAERLAKAGADFSSKPEKSARDEEKQARSSANRAPDTGGVPSPESPLPAPVDEEPHAKGGGGDVINIDLDALIAKGMITPRGDRSRMTEEYRIIKRPLLSQAFATGEDAVKDGNLIMVTSAIPGEGKTFTSVNLAMSIAKERDLYVLLVDADLSRPSVMKTLGAKADRGFVDLLEDESLNVSDVLARTSIPNLSIIPAGRSHPMGTELLASERAGQVIGEIARRYRNRVIIFDTAPVLASSEGGALVKHVGQILLVVEYERTRNSEVVGALDMLDTCDNISLMLNKARTRLASGQFGSAYYGKYYSGDE